MRDIIGLSPILCRSNNIVNIQKIITLYIYSSTTYPLPMYM